MEAKPEDPDCRTPRRPDTGFTAMEAAAGTDLTRPAGRAAGGPVGVVRGSAAGVRQAEAGTIPCGSITYFLAAPLSKSW